MQRFITLQIKIIIERMIITMIKDSKFNKKEYNPYFLTEIQPQGGIKLMKKL
ncbi:hypothetical protein H477_0306 [[Clostridium] sordellii ATCC 9714]|nr:hypothetical protein H477_0306 [[Clostridium] sordellii ATCC 9714] [Paeniclostridium sordellii ATCC 9714]